MDRNTWDEALVVNQERVATREGGVDRNNKSCGKATNTAVATREGGVDRNLGLSGLRALGLVSPPARVAWIETITTSTVVIRTVRRHPRGWRG